MKYKPEVKSEVIDLYRGGMPRRRISESQGIPLPTVRSWTQDIVSAERHRSNAWYVVRRSGR